MAEIEIGLGKTARSAYRFDDVTIVPSRRTRDPQEVSLAWEIDAYRLELPLLVRGVDSVVSPDTARRIGQLGACAVLNLEGLWTRYRDPEPRLAEIAELGRAPDRVAALRRLQEIYAEPISEELIGERLAQLKAGGAVTAASLTPQKVQRYAKYVLDAGIDLFVIAGTVVSAEHVATRSEPLNLKRFIAELDVPVLVGGCASFSTALHLMRSGAAGLLVGVGPDRSPVASGVLGVGVPTATAVADVAGARMRYLDESGGRYVHVIADGGIRTGADVAKAIACGADAVMLGAPLARSSDVPGRGWHWEMEAAHAELPRGEIVAAPPVGTLEEVLVGPSRTADGSTNLFGALRRAMATTGYASVKEFQKAELVVR